MRAGIRSRPWVGLDVGSFSVKLLASRPGVGVPHHWIAERPLPASAANGQAPEVVARVVADCLAAAGLSPRGLRGVSLAVSGADVIVKQITLPLLTDDEVAPALRFESRKHLPFDPEAMVLDFQIVGRYLSDKKLEVLLAAVPQARLERALAPLALLGMEADIVDAAPLALTNALSYKSEGDREAKLLLDIGHEASHLTLYQRGQPYFSRRIEFGGLTLTRAISEGTRVPLEEAEEWKLAAGSDTPGFRVDWDSPEMQAMLDVLRHDLVDELRRSFAFYRTLGTLSDPLRLWVSGGSARLPGLAARLSELLGFPALLFDPLEALGGGAREGEWPAAGPQFAQAFGLTLRSA